MVEALISDLYAPDSSADPVVAAPGVSVLETLPIARLSFRGREAAIAAAGPAFGTELPRGALASSTEGAHTALWLGPDEWLLLAPEEATGDVMARLSDALGDHPNSLVDVSDRQDAVLVSGPKAEWLLNSGVPIDLTVGAFPVGMVTRTLFHKCDVMIWRTGHDTFVVEAWGSFMSYVKGLLSEAARELKAG